VFSYAKGKRYNHAREEIHRVLSQIEGGLKNHGFYIGGSKEREKRRPEENSIRGADENFKLGLPKNI